MACLRAAWHPPARPLRRPASGNSASCRIALWRPRGPYQLNDHRRLSATQAYAWDWSFCLGSLAPGGGAPVQGNSGGADQSRALLKSTSAPETWRDGSQLRRQRTLTPRRSTSLAENLAGTHLHDLRHTGNQFTADAGANPRELMARMGHDSPRAALIYLHSSTERQRDLANQVGKNAKAALRKPVAKPKRSGTRVARNQRNAS